MAERTKLVVMESRRKKRDKILKKKSMYKVCVTTFE